MNKTLFSFTALVSMAFASDHTVYSGEVNATKSDLNLTANILRTKTCDAIEKIGKAKDGKLQIDMSKVKTDNANPMFAKVNGVLMPNVDSYSYGIISRMCYTIPTAEAAFEAELGAKGLSINAFDPSTEKLQQKLLSFGATETYAVIIGLGYQYPELLGAFIDKVKEKRFGRNTIGIPEAKDIFVDGTYKKELTPDEEKLVDGIVTKYLAAISKEII